jgi:hypothetical protein
MKKFIAVTAVAGALVLGSTALAGPGPGLPDYGQRVTEPEDIARGNDLGDHDDAPYALTGPALKARSGASGPTLVQHYGRGGQKAGDEPRYDMSNN